MTEWFLQKNVFYPSWIFLTALVWFFVGRKIGRHSWLALMILGLVVTLGGLGLSLLFGLPLKEIPKALIFEANPPVLGFRRWVFLGYSFFLAGFLLLLRSLVSRGIARSKTSRS